MRMLPNAVAVVVAFVRAGGTLLNTGAGIVTLSLLVGGTAAMPAAAQVKVLVDASKDGGLWWFPQSGPFDPALPHQGKGLADHLRSRGMVVDEMPRPEVMTCERLSQYPVVVVFAACNPHSPDELEAYATYLARGGRLILFGEHSCTQCVLAHSLGVHFSGAVHGPVRSFTSHPITAGVAELPFVGGSTVDTTPATATTLATLDGAPVMGIMPVGAGRVFYFSDTTAFLLVQRPFVDNLFGHMLAGAAPVDACTPTTAPGPPEILDVDSVQDRIVRLRFWPPLGKPTPTGYVLKGGLAPGQTLAALPTGSTAPVFTFTAPKGSFFVRMHSEARGVESVPSNEIRINVGTPFPPFPPSGVVATVNGSDVVLAWRNSYGGGTPTALRLDVSGSLTASIPLGLTDRFAFSGVPAGTYTLALRALNASGTSSPSFPVTLSFPGACSGVPLPPTDVLAYRQGRTIVVRWEPARTGPAPSEYVLNVTGAHVGQFRTIGRTLSGTVGPGSYGLSVRATNACGASAFTPQQIVTVP
jgi:hypothetical protein